MTSSSLPLIPHTNIPSNRSKLNSAIGIGSTKPSTATQKSIMSTSPLENKVGELYVDVLEKLVVPHFCIFNFQG
jgi:hypothetical protein